MRIYEIVESPAQATSAATPEMEVRVPGDQAARWFRKHFEHLRITNRFPFPDFNAGQAIIRAQNLYTADQRMSLSAAVQQATAEQENEHSPHTAHVYNTQPHYDTDRFKTGADGRQLKHDRYYSHKSINIPGVEFGKEFLDIARTSNPFSAVARGYSLGKKI